jgi:RNA-directed DNA polymerase
MTQENSASAVEATQGREAAGGEGHGLWWAEASIWTDRMVLALGNGVKGGKWFSLVDKVNRPSTLEAAWHKVERNKGSSGIDGQSIERFATAAAGYLAELHETLKSGQYRPSPVKRVEIPKGGGQTRPLGIPTVKDRIVQTAIKMAIEPIFETQFRNGSYGFRPGRSCKDALRQVDRLLKEGYVHVVDADLKSYFDTIPHDRLMAQVAHKISDGRVLELIKGYLCQDVMKGMEQWTPTTGTPQGAVISPLLANIYLHPFDLLMEQSGYRMVRYADDFVILCRTAEEATAALHQVMAWTTANGLTLHPDKTRIGDAREPGQGFDFLGYRFEGGRRFVRKKSLKAFKDKVRGKTGRSRGVSLERIVADLNPRLRGWFGYFKHAAPSEFRLLDSFIRRRLRAILRKQEKRPAFGRCPEDHQRWPNAFFASLGLFTLSTARYQARHSR